MGMISEIHAEIQAEIYEKILLSAIDNNKLALTDKPIYDGIISFCKEHIYLEYKKELGDAWRIKASEVQLTIEKFFENN